MAEIRMGSTVTLQYTVKTDDGAVIDASEQDKPLIFTVGETEIISGLVNQVLGLKKSDRKSFSIPPKEAYREYNPDFVRNLPRNMFPDDIDLKAGDSLVAASGDGQEIPFTIREAAPEGVVADFNHVLAGKALHFDVEIIEVRDATATVGDD